MCQKKGRLVSFHEWSMQGDQIQHDHHHYISLSSSLLLLYHPEYQLMFFFSPCQLIYYLNLIIIFHIMKPFLRSCNRGPPGIIILQIIISSLLVQFSLQYHFYLSRYNILELCSSIFWIFQDFCAQDVESAFKDCYYDVAPFYEHHQTQNHTAV